MRFAISMPQKKNRSTARWGCGLHLPAQSALSSAFMVKNSFQKTRIWLEFRFNDYRSLNSNMMLKIEF
jgi:hypothetical protein